MITLSVKWSRKERLRLVIGKCQQCHRKQTFHLEPERAEFKQWISFCMTCDGASVFDLVV